MRILNQIANVYSGYQARGALQHNPNGQFYLLQGKDLDDSQDIDSQHLLRLEPSGSPERYLVFSGDILFQARGAMNKAYYIENVPDNTLAAATFYILRVNTQTVLPAYLSWYLNQRQSQGFFRAHASGSTVSFISRETLLDLEVEIPDLKTQKLIQQIQVTWQREKVLMNAYKQKQELLIQEFCLKASKHGEMET